MLEAQCSTATLKNPSLYEKDANGKLKPPAALVDNLCPNDCSCNGKCVKGSCECNTDFVGRDCSLSPKIPPEIEEIRGDILCDKRKNHPPCDSARILGEKFIESDKLTCHVQEYSVSHSKYQEQK